MIEGILPKGVAVVEDVSDAPGDITGLFPEEEALISTALSERRHQFAAARACARQAMERLGEPSRPVPADATGAPKWPAGLVGSITHCRGYRAAALGRSGDLVTLGIDADPNLPLREGVLPLVASPEEQARLRDLSRRMPEVHLDRVLFSAKEAAYKAWFPLHGVRLGFKDAELILSGRACDGRRGGSGDVAAGTFRARLLAQDITPPHAPLEVFQGRWSVRESFIMTAVARIRRPARRAFSDV
ncbi:4'-phosphopantetheinyl transferase superfamily protein [Streptomyces sp. NPDC005181]|uniref:4'-phosphopantetheinyl transferase family protein n=1 Tax=Streptomyces sp. NPDC005181 TaxID=3156869 RepID=UPI00339F6C64